METKKREDSERERDRGTDRQTEQTDSLTDRETEIVTNREAVDTERKRGGAEKQKTDQAAYVKGQNLQVAQTADNLESNVKARNTVVGCIQHT